jgi:hypothetical protein
MVIISQTSGELFELFSCVDFVKVKQIGLWFSKVDFFQKTSVVIF